MTSTMAATQDEPSQPVCGGISYVGGQNYGARLLNNFMLWFGLCLSVPNVPPRKRSGPHCAAAPAVPWAGAEAGARALPSQQTLTP